MLKAISGNTEFQIEFDDEKKQQGSLNGKKFSWDILKIKEGSFHVIMDDVSYRVDVLRSDPETKTFTIRVNGNKYPVRVKDKYDELLQKLGMENGTGKKQAELKAPMPGLVLDVRVQEGKTINANDPVLVLEAMKMENILKSQAGVTIKKIHVKKGDTVEKGQVLVTYM